MAFSDMTSEPIYLEQNGLGGFLCSCNQRESYLGTCC